MAKEIRRLGERHKQQQVTAKVFVATPAYDGKVDTAFAVALAETCQMATALDIGVTASVMGNGAFIEIARNVFVKMFLETDCTHLFFIDADLRWEARAFIGLVNANRPVSAGIYRRRQDDEDYPVHYIEDPENPGVMTVDGGWIACDRVPTGFLCIRRDVVEAMSAAAPTWYIKSHGAVPALFYTKLTEEQKADGSRGFVGEDYAFCDDYMQKFRQQFDDQPIMVWPDFDFTHGRWQGNWWEYIQRVSAEFLTAKAAEEAAA